MTPMRVRELGTARDGRRAVIVLEDLEQQFRLVFSTDVHEAHRLAKELGRGPCQCNPAYDFIETLLRVSRATISRVVLDDVPGKGLEGLVALDRGPASAPLTLPCFPPDALALALRAKAPIFATAQALAHAESLARRHTLPGERAVRRWLNLLAPNDF
jgi:bifunctional DNase/RNase